jgi:hypothetical protein
LKAIGSQFSKQRQLLLIRLHLVLQPIATNPPPGRVPRVAKLMALAIRFDQLIRDGVVADQSELARIGQVSRVLYTCFLISKQR